MDIYSPGWSFLLFLLGLPACLIWVAMGLIFNIWKLRWRRSISLLLTPFLAVGTSVALTKLGLDPTLIRFELTSEHYEREVEALPSEQRLLAWPWGVAGASAVTAGEDYYLIYDESDQISLKPDQRNSGWLAAAEAKSIPLPTANSPNDGGPGISLRQLSGHYYLAEISN
jgi:hypothetical protein